MKTSFLTVPIFREAFTCANEKAATDVDPVTASFISGPSWARSSDPVR